MTKNPHKLSMSDTEESEPESKRIRVLEPKKSEKMKAWRQLNARDLRLSQDLRNHYAKKTTKRFFDIMQECGVDAGDTVDVFLLKIDPMGALPDNYKKIYGHTEGFKNTVTRTRTACVNMATIKIPTADTVLDSLVKDIVGTPSKEVMTTLVASWNNNHKHVHMIGCLEKENRIYQRYHDILNDLRDRVNLDLLALCQNFEAENAKFLAWALQVKTVTGASSVHEATYEGWKNKTLVQPLKTPRDETAWLYHVMDKLEKSPFFVRQDTIDSYEGEWWVPTPKFNSMF